MNDSWQSLQTKKRPWGKENPNLIRFLGGFRLLNAAGSNSSRTEASLHEMLLGQPLRALRALFRQHHRLRLAHRVINVAALVQAIQNIPVMALPRPQPMLVRERRQVEQSLFTTPDIAEHNTTSVPTMTDPTFARMNVGFETFAAAVFVWASIDYNRFIKFWMLKPAPYTRWVKVFFRIFFPCVCNRWDMAGWRRFRTIGKVSQFLPDRAPLHCGVVRCFLRHVALGRVDEDEARHQDPPLTI